MFAFQKATPTEYIIQYRKGRQVRTGAGLAFWYYVPKTVVVKVPLQTREANFMFKEFSADFQEVTVQGRMTWRIAEPQALAERMNYAVNSQDNYISDDPEKLEDRVLNLAQVAVQAQLRKGNLKQLLAAPEPIRNQAKTELRNNEVLQGLGIEVIDVALQAVKPSPEMSRAMEADVREQILQEADDALYTRRTAALEQEREIKETELNTQIALEKKQQQITETQLEAEKVEQIRRQELAKNKQTATLNLANQKREADIAEQRERETAKLELQRKRQDASLAADSEQQTAELALKAERMTTDLSLAADEQQLIAMQVEDARKQAEVDIYKTTETLKAYEGIDPRVLLAMNAAEVQPMQALAFALQGFAEQGLNVGEVNFSPDLLKQVANAFNGGNSPQLEK